MSEEPRFSDQGKVVRFEEIALPHLSAAYNLARWLVHNEHDAEDLVQEAFLRAFKSFSGYYGGNSRAWVLTIVRNTCYTWLQRNRVLDLAEPIDDKLDELELDLADPEMLFLQSVNAQIVRQALQELPVEFREVVVLREMEGLAYKEIANVIDVPLGTVMSRLARGRKRLQSLLANQMGKEANIELSANA
ncbi:MAG TPA: sigma-70 family RNA polymerase sigma factor [Pyrinomonadaceae bacterium]|nr:sigma-70 family RNA polymerase sigma factor [Pyrinomonadaceae bacterium]